MATEDQTPSTDDILTELNGLTQAVSCRVHTKGNLDKDCAACIGESSAFAAEMQSIGDRINGKRNDLHRSGINMPDVAFLSIRLESLLDALMNDRQRMEYEFVTANRTVEMLSEMQAEVRKQQEPSIITPNTPNGIIVP